VVRGQGQGLLKTLFLSFSDIDWATTKAYSLGNVGQIYINVAGREPQGCVQPGAEYDAVCQEIITRLRQLRDPRSGEPVVEHIYRREEIYSGDYLEQAPDIVFIPTRMEYFGFGEYEFGSHKIIEPLQRGISGTHRMNGIFMAYGANIRPLGELSGAQITDLAPTILHLMGEPVPSHMDGRVLTELLPAGFRPVQQVDSREWEPQPADEGEALTEEEMEILTGRLRDLGYVG
jgi:predicted AlkP superfamily phosphohydrolase/phosphomutase